MLVEIAGRSGFARFDVLLNIDKDSPSSTIASVITVMASNYVVIWNIEKLIRDN